MLTLTRSQDSRAATDYFVKGLSTEGYYLADNIKASWTGKTAEQLNLYGKDVTRNDFADLATNINPNTKERLTVRNVENRRAGFDLTFSAVKSVSVLYALTRDNAILEAHQYAYRQAMLEVQKNAQTQANTKEKRVYQNTGNIIYAAFDHFTSRPNKVSNNGKTEFISDPQLHTHCYVPNVTWNEELQRYQAIEMGNIHRLATYYEAIYHAHLSKSLQELGFVIERNSNRYEVFGVTRKTIEKFSNRSAAIEQIAKQKGITDVKTKAKLGAISRNSKDKAINEKKLLGYWKKRLSDKDLQSLYTLKNTLKRTKKPITPKKAIDRAIAHFEERQSAYQEKRVLAHALTLGYGHLLPNDVQHELNKRENIFKAEIDSVRYITTTEMVRAEEQMIRLASQGKSTTLPIHPDYRTKQGFLNDDQQKAIHQLLNSSDQVIILKGGAGVGKTSLLTEINTAVKEKSQKLIALAPSSQATKQLLKKGFEADTIAGFLINTKKQQELKNNVLLVDEAGMTGVKTMSQLLQLGVKHNARIILSGDTKQHKSIEFGDSLRILEEKAKLQIVEVSKVVRQQNEAYKKAVEYLARGQTIKGYNALDKMGAIQEIPDHEQRIKRIAEDYSKSIQQKKSTLIISPTNHEGDMINIQVRNTLKKQGIIQGKEKEFTTLKNLSFTKSQKQDTQLYQNGQIIRFISNQKGGYKAGQHYEVQQQTPQTPLQIRNKQTGKLLPLPHQNPENYQVFDKIQTQLAKGDRIRLTQNSKSLQGSKMNNGTVYQVSGFTRSGDIKLTNNKILAKENGHYKYSYSETSYSSQGKDAKNILISMSDISFMGVSKEQFYVSVSRGTHNAKIYTSDKQELKKLIHKSNERITAKEITYYKRNPNQDFLRRQQKEHYVSSTKVLKYVKKENTQNKDIL